MVIEVILLALAVFFILLAASGLALIARTRGARREPAAWCGPLAFTSAAAVLLTAAGVLSPVAGAVLAALLLGVLAATLAPAWADVRAEAGAGTATGVILARLAGRLRDAVRNAREDVRDLAGMAHHGAPAAQAAPESRGDQSAGGPQRWAAATRARHVPPLMEDPYLGAHPYPADVATSLELDRVPVPPHWDRTAQVISDFDPEDDDDTQGHLAAEAAGVLTVAAAVENRAEHLAFAVGLDPAIIEAHYDIAEGFAELATRYALLVRRDHLVMGDLREYRDNGGVIPHDGRRYMDAGDPRPDGGHAA